MWSKNWLASMFVLAAVFLGLGGVVFAIPGAGGEGGKYRCPPQCPGPNDTVPLRCFTAANGQQICIQDNRPLP